MGKVKTKTKSTELKVQGAEKQWWGSNVTYNPELEDKEVIFVSDAINEANKVIANLELPKFDKDGNYIP